MAKIDRYDGNLLAFAINALAQERTVFGDTTESDTLDDNLNTDFFRGFGIVGVNDLPTKQDFQALGFTLGQLLAYLHQIGVAEWNTNQEYHDGSLTFNGSALYISNTNSNTGNDPATEPEWDLLIGVEGGEFVIGAGLQDVKIPGELVTLESAGPNTGADYQADAKGTGTSSYQLLRDGVIAASTQHSDFEAKMRMLNFLTAGNSTGLKQLNVGDDGLLEYDDGLGGLAPIPQLAAYFSVAANAASGSVALGLADVAYVGAGISYDGNIDVVTRAQTTEWQVWHNDGDEYFVSVPSPYIRDDFIFNIQSQDQDSPPNSANIIKVYNNPSDSFSIRINIGEQNTNQVAALGRFHVAAYRVKT